LSANLSFPPLSRNRWLTIEPFIVPGLFEPFNDAGINHNATVVDEWTLCEALGSNMSAAITEHYDTFIVSSPRTREGLGKRRLTLKLYRLRRISPKSLLPASTGFVCPSPGGSSRCGTTSLSSPTSDGPVRSLHFQFHELEG
jgi:hypothetical protein